MPRRPIDPTKPSTTVAGAWSGKGVFDLIFSELLASGPTETADVTRARGGDYCATDLKAHPTAFRLNRGAASRLIGRTSQGSGPVVNSMGSAPAKVVPCRLHLSERQWSDATDVDVVLKDLPPAAAVIGDKGYDSDKTRKMLAQQGISPCIPPRRSPKKAVHHSKGMYRMRHKIENLFSRPNDWRPIATRL